MQIELIGCTSSGKSSLAQNMVRSNHPNGSTLITSYDFVLRWSRLDWVKNHRLRMLLLNLIAVLACVITWRKNLSFYRFVIGVIMRLPAKVGPFEKLKLARIVARNVGINEIVRRNSSGRQIVIADEGTLHIAHYLFVHVSVEPNMSDLETFLRLVSLPDVAVYVRQPESVLISRTSTRGHKRIPENSSALVNQFIKHGLAVFDKLSECSSLEGLLLTVNGGERIKPVRAYPTDPRLEYVRKIIEFEIDPVSGESVSVEEVN